jgi:hypothetical protein
MVVALLLFLLSMLPAGSAQETTLRVYPQTKTTYVNQTFNIEIKVENVNNLYSFEFKLSWNASILNCTDENLHPPPEWGTNWFVWPQNKWERIQSGLYVVAVTALSPAPPFSGNASLVTLTFKALSVGSTTLDLHDTILGDYPDANEIPHTVIDGTVNVSTQPVGGIQIPVDKLKLLAPYIAYAFIVSIAVVAIVFKHRKRER